MTEVTRRPLAELRGFVPVYAAAVEGRALAGLGAVELGTGKAAAAASLAELLLRARPGGVFLFGVCGAYPPRHRRGGKGAPEAHGPQVGDLCLVDPDGFGDEGVAVEGGFLDLAALGLGATGPFAAARATAAVAARLGVPVVPGATVSTCSGTEASSAMMAARTGAVVETMEGAAVASVCARHGVPLVQLRAVSNVTGDRERGEWDLERAVRRVQDAVRMLFGGA